MGGFVRTLGDGRAGHKSHDSPQRNTSMRILIAGARGMLGTDLLEELGTVHQVAGLGHGDLDITDAEQCKARVFEVHPEIVINAAAMTDVDGCESREEEAFLVNGHGAGNL